MYGECWWMLVKVWWMVDECMVKVGECLVNVWNCATDFPANVNFRITAWQSSQYGNAVSCFIRHSSDIREIEPFPLISIQKYYFLPEYARALRFLILGKWTDVNWYAVLDSSSADTDEGFGTEIGKIGSEGVKIKFEAKRKRQEIGWKQKYIFENTN